MSERSEELETMLAAILAGDLSEDDPSVRDALRSAPEFGARLERLRTMQGRLDRVAEGEHRSVERALAARGFDLEAAAARARARAARLRWSGAALAKVGAAAVVVAALVWWAWPSAAAPADPRIYLGGVSADVTDSMRPHGSYAAAPVFEWRVDGLAVTDTIELYLYDGEDLGGEPVEPVALSELTPVHIETVGHARTWDSSELVESLPVDLVWAVVKPDATGAPQILGIARARRRE